jgi:SWI/SNF-related matrix-associated actin-dependent regulator 1 of chromatin subfamily A
MYRHDPIVSSSPPRATSHSDDERQDPYATQPTQMLGERSPFFAAPSDTTQPTLILTPPANRIQPASSQLQVPRSSPAAQRYSSPTMSPSQSQRGYGYSNPMAPPGTSFFPPQPVRRTVVDLTSDDPPVDRDPDEDESELRSNIPLSKIERTSSTSRIEETPQKRPWDLSKYKHGSFNDQSRKRPSDGYGSSTPPKKQKLPLQRQRQGGPSRAMPVDLTEDGEMTLEDISDTRMRRNVERLTTIYLSRSIKQLYDALVRKKGNFEDASAYLADQGSDDELLPSPNFGVAHTKSNLAPKKTAQRTLQQPVKSLHAKYSKLGATRDSSATVESNEDEPPKPRRRLKQGRKRTPSPEPTPPPQPRPQQQPKTKKQQAPVVISSDAEDIDEGVPEMLDDDSDASGAEPEDTFDSEALVDFFNTCTVEAMVDVSSMPKEEISEVLKQRPFASLDDVRKVHVDLTPAEKGKKKARIRFATCGLYQRHVERILHHRLSGPEVWSSRQAYGGRYGSLGHQHLRCIYR